MDDTMSGVRCESSRKVTATTSGWTSVQDTQTDGEQIEG